MRISIFLMILLLLSAPAFTQDVSSYSIDLEFFPADAAVDGDPVSPQQYMRGVAEIGFAGISSDTLAFYLHGELSVDSILCGGGKIEFSSERVFYYYDYSMIASRIVFDAARVKENPGIQVFYSGFFNRSRARGLSDYMRADSEDGVYLRAYNYSLWFPAFREPDEEPGTADFERVAVSVPEEFTVVVAGEHVDDETAGGVRTSVWRPGMSDLRHLQIAARKYRSVTKKGVHVYYVGDEAQSGRILDYAIGLKELFSGKLRPVDRDEPLFIIELPRYGDISSDNVVGISERVYSEFENEDYSRLTIAHELVHPYVRIPVTNDSPFAALVIEGFPSFFQLWALKRMDEDFDHMRWIRWKERRYLAGREAGDPVEKPILEITYDEIGAYKDRFVLSDRVWLFLFDLWTRAGDNRFDLFCKELFALDTLDYGTFEAIVEKHVPGYGPRLDKWLNTTVYDESMALETD